MNFSGNRKVRRESQVPLGMLRGHFFDLVKDVAGLEILNSMWGVFFATNCRSRSVWICWISSRRSLWWWRRWSSFSWIWRSSRCL